eukprot:COSAG04_NODE_9791_length_832_cov_0.830832_2_plen_126_part_01
MPKVVSRAGSVQRSAVRARAHASKVLTPPVKLQPDCAIDDLGLRHDKLLTDRQFLRVGLRRVHRGASADDTGGERLVAHAGVTIRHDRCRLRASALANAPLEPARRESYTASLTRPYTAQGPSPLL